MRDIVAGTPPRPGGAVYYQARVFSMIPHALEVRLVTRCAPDDRDLLGKPLALTRADLPPETLTALRRDGRQLLVDAQGFVRRGTLGPLVRDGKVPPEHFAAVRVQATLSGSPTSSPARRVQRRSTPPGTPRK